ncbi:hypothetical protein IEO21_01316 [Rhodonia placenta]|uniref:Uncharacterized protein n=1 Tax=Rhodonia placenta TaxID=104341 RepID=A0A8H7P9T9_9APHY|nr:hypothetical protein IEO21_01316 [Postia placenta]
MVRPDTQIRDGSAVRHLGFDGLEASGVLMCTWLVNHCPMRFPELQDENGKVKTTLDSVSEFLGPAGRDVNDRPYGRRRISAVDKQTHDSGSDDSMRIANTGLGPERRIPSIVVRSLLDSHSDGQPRTIDKSSA